MDVPKGGTTKRGKRLSEGTMSHAAELSQTLLQMLAHLDIVGRHVHISPSSLARVAGLEPVGPGVSLACRDAGWLGKRPSLQPEGYVHQADHDRHLDQRPDDRSEGFA